MAETTRSRFRYVNIGANCQNTNMTKIQKKIPVPTPRPQTIQQNKEVKRSSPVGQETKKLDTSQLSGAVNEPAASSGVNNLISGLKEWGGSETAKSEVKALSLDKGELLRKGMSGDKVRQLQELLNSKGAGLELDGKFGGDTLKALREFQKTNDLGVDGVLGSKTLEKLNGTGDAAAVAKNPEVGEQKKADAEPGKETGDRQQTSPANGRFADAREALDKLPGPLKKYADHFQKMGEQYGVDPRFLASISMHETGNGRSSAFRNKNNAMGISNRRGPIHMSSVEKSIERMAQALSKPNGYYKGKNTIGQIGKVYAPVGAANDPNGLNGHWAKGVAKNFRMFGGDPTQQVVFR